MKTLLTTITIILFTLGATAQTIVPDPLGNPQCRCAEIDAIPITWIGEPIEIAFICTQLTWNMDTVARGNFFFEVRHYRPDSSVYYTRMSNCDLLPNNGDYTISGLPLTWTIGTIIPYTFSYIQSTLGLIFTYKTP